MQSNNCSKSNDPVPSPLTHQATGEMLSSTRSSSDNNFTPWTIGTTDVSQMPSDQRKQLVNAKSESFIQLIGNQIEVASDRTSSEDELSISSPPNNRTSQTRTSYTQLLLQNPPMNAAEAVLANSCQICKFDIAEVWLRTGPKTHQLIISYLRPAGILENSVRKELVEVYYGEQSSERRHRLSPALCKRAKEANDVVWVTAATPQGAEALRCSISDVHTAVAVPVCHTATGTNVTFLYFSIKRIRMKTVMVELLVHMSLASAVASVNSMSDDTLDSSNNNTSSNSSLGISSQPSSLYSSTTAIPMDMRWNQLRNVEYLTDGANSWIHTAVMNGKPVVVKTLKPECQDLAHAINEIEDELSIHSKLNHIHIAQLLGAGTSAKGHRFLVLERLDGGTLSQMLGYDSRIRDRRRRFWRRKQFTLKEILFFARSMADALAYCHSGAIEGSMVLHRDLKPDNIGLTLDGTLKLIDFGLARVVENANPYNDQVYEMSGETGSLRYMSPEVAESKPYNHKSDVYSFSIILWELMACKKPYDGLNRDSFYEQVVHGGGRPPIHRKWPKELSNLMVDCWSVDIESRPTFEQILTRLDSMIRKNISHGKNYIKKDNSGEQRKKTNMLTTMIDRHSTWF